MCLNGGLFFIQYMPGYLYLLVGQRPWSALKKTAKIFAMVFIIFKGNLTEHTCHDITFLLYLLYLRGYRSMLRHLWTVSKRAHMVTKVTRNVKVRSTCPSDS